MICKGDREFGGRERVNLESEEAWKTGAWKEKANAVESMSVRIKVHFPLFQPDMSFRQVSVYCPVLFFLSQQILFFPLTTIYYDYNYELAL